MARRFITTRGSHAYIRKNRLNKRSFIKHAMEFHGYMQRSGTPSKLFTWVSKPENKKWRPYLSRLDHKYSHRIMRKTGLMS